MRPTNTKGEKASHEASLRYVVTPLIVACIVGLAVCAWISSSPAILPTPESSAGESLLNSYLRIAHQLWLIALIVLLGNLIQKIIRIRIKQSSEGWNTMETPLKQSIYFVNKNRLTTVLFIAYTIAMISGTTYLYADMIGWYPDLIDGHFLNNFSIKQSLIKETMRRTDFRFFPLAHQDIHILSWFSINIKTWMLVSSMELISIVLLSVRFLNKLCAYKTAQQSTILLLAILILIHPSTGTAFFQVIYSERLLCLFFVLHINAYINYQQHQHREDFYFSLLWAGLGVFTKDTAIILFVIPAITNLLISATKSRQELQPINQEAIAKFQHKHHLELWLCIIGLAFITSYLFLSLLPSVYAQEGAYNDNIPEGFIPDIRFYIFTLIILMRVIGIASERLQYNLLDAINVSAICYTITLSFVYEFNSNSYLTLPVNLIIAINIGWLWMTAVDSRFSPSLKSSKLISGSIAASALLISVEHIASDQPFAKTIADMKIEQDSNQKTYNRLYDIAKEYRKQGKPINIIINRKSRLSERRLLYRIPYHSLIEYDSKTNTFNTTDGETENDSYTLKEGDIIANLDKSVNLINPILEGVEAKLIYRHNPSKQTGMILEITKVKP
ncbi:hypothetical protein [Synechococcus sp. UW179A]|uniref:hypothetical protein n=1 Tax=Synechococcus sp. UW179A TaxID=2575510 RepID=UPI000E0E8C95|nr:hypothetical protein [Synechococcus sp. UW179A]